MVAGAGLLGFGSAGLEAAGKIVEGNAYREAGRANQKIAEYNAAGIERDTAAKEAGIREDVRRTIGTQLAAQGESGFQLGTGSAVDALMASQVNGMLDRLTVRAHGQAEAASTRFSGAMARREGNAKATASYLSAAAGLMKSAANYAAGGG